MASRVLLIVDDEPIVARGLVALFRKRGYAAAMAVTAADAIATVRQGLIDGAIVDFRIPDMRGDVLHASLMAIQPHLAHRVVFLTGDISDVVEEALSDTGCPIVLKPFELVELERIVAETIGPADVEERYPDADAL